MWLLYPFAGSEFGKKREECLLFPVCPSPQKTEYIYPWLHVEKLKFLGVGKELLRFRGKYLAVLSNPTWVHSPKHSKANLLMLGCGDGKCSVYCRCQTRSMEQLMLKSPELLDGFPGKVFKESVSERISGYVISSRTFFFFFFLFLFFFKHLY